MTPKNPEELRKQVEEQAKKSAKRGHERTAEGEEVRMPKRVEFFKNLKKASRPSQED
jgi:hypothetical protein